MFDFVLIARDKYLAEGGHLFPDKATIYIASLEDDEYRKTKIDFWDDVYGVNMSCIKEWAMKEPLVDNVDHEYINSNEVPIFNVDLKTVKLEDLDFNSEYCIKICRDDYVHALVAWYLLL